MDAEGNDTGELSLSTGSLNTTDLTNRSYSSNQSFGVNASIGVSDAANPADPAQSDSDLALNSSNYSYQSESSQSLGKTLATIGEGSVSVNGEDTSPEGVNRDVASVNKEIYDVDRQQGNIDLTVDHRLLSEDGRKQIAEDAKRTKIMGDSIIDAVADSVSLTGSGEGESSLRDHMGNKQDYFTATKNFTQNPANAEHVETLSDNNATPEQKQAAYTALVNEIADYMGVDPTEAKVLMANDPRFAEVAGAHSRDTDTVYVNDAEQNNASDAVNTVGHETQHYLDNQQNPDAEQTNQYKANREEYAGIMGDATEDYLGFNFAQNDTSLADGNSHSFGTTADDVLTNLNLLSENQKAYDSENQGSLDHNILAAVPAAEAGLGLAALGIVAATGDEDAKRQFAQDVEQLFNDVNELLGGETSSPDTINTEYVVNELIALKVKEEALIEEGSDNYHAFNEIYEKRASLTQNLPAGSRAGINDTVTAFVNDFNEGNLGNSGGFQAADEPAVIAMPNPVQDSPGTTVLDNTPPEIPGEAGGYEPGESLPSVEGSPVQDGHWSDHLVFNDTVQEADPNKIKFTQDSIKNSFKDGQSIEKLVEGLKSGEISAEKVPAIRVFEKNGETYSLDNRRLKAFQDAGVPIKTVPATAEEIANESYKFTSKTDGKSIRIRGGK